MAEILSWSWPFIIGILLFLVGSSVAGAPGRFLKQKFDRLGDVAGKSEEEIVAVVGSAQGVTAGDDGKKILQWSATGYQIALVFDAEGKCEGVNQEIQSA